MGRKPKHSKAMTGAERMHEYRKRKASVGAKEFYFSMNSKLTGQIDDLVDFYELSGRAQAISDLIERPLIEALKIRREWKSIPELQSIAKTPEEVKTLKKIKHEYWNALCAKVSRTKRARKKRR